MEQYFSDWIKIIEGMNPDNSDQPAWGKAILECIIIDRKYESLDDGVVVYQYDIVQKMMKYYWNQTFYFDLSQGRNPIMLQIVKEMIEYYHQVHNKTKTKNPKSWSEVELFFKNRPQYFERMIHRFITASNSDVASKFKQVGKERVLIYKLDKKNKRLVFNLNDIMLLQEYGMILIQLLNNKWAQLLEQYNHAPNIYKKVLLSSNAVIKRSNLNKYRSLLLEFYDDKLSDFYTDEIVELSDVTVDHVFPWNYMCQDDIWNLVITSKKTNRLPNRTEISKLKNRNLKLLHFLKNRNAIERRNIEFAIENHLIDKYYVDKSE